MELVERARGMLVGLAVGDALGLPREGLAPARAARMFGPSLHHAFWFGRGVVSDDTEHAFLTGQALLTARDDDSRFARALAWRLRGWIATLPPGVGWATLRACVLLCLGIPPSRSGRMSAGSGPLMRAPVIGFAVRDPERRRVLVDLSTRATHTHPLAVEAARAVADLAAAARDGEGSVKVLLPIAADHLCNPAWRNPLARLEHALDRKLSPPAWADAEGLSGGITGYVVHTLPAVLYCWLRDPVDYSGVVTAAISLGGDTDTVAAIAGALAGAAAGRPAVPDELIDRIVDWPLAPARLDTLADRLVALLEDAPARPLRIPLAPLRLLRNLAVGGAAVVHVVRRWIVALAGG